MTVLETGNRYLTFDREEWAALRAATPLTLREDDLENLRGINDRIDLDEVAAVYLPLTRLLNLYVAATQNLHKVSAAFLGTLAPKVPYVIGVAGSVAVGKSTFARILQALLARWPDHPTVDLVTTDGFLYPNRVLDERGIMNRKGFPESYDTRRLIEFLRQLKSGCADGDGAGLQPRRLRHRRRRRGRRAPARHRDRRGPQRPPGRRAVDRPDRPTPASSSATTSTSASSSTPTRPHIEQWYVRALHDAARDRVPGPEQLLPALRRSHRRRRPIDTARFIWREINGKNLRENIDPTKARARLMLRKGADHRVTTVALRRL